MSLKTLESNIKYSFDAVKKDVAVMQGALREYKNMMKTLNDNQKLLLKRLQRLEGKKPVTLIKNGNKEYFGAETTKMLHNPVCPYAKNVKPKNKIVFKSKTATTYNISIFAIYFTLRNKSWFLII